MNYSGDTMIGDITYGTIDHLPGTMFVEMSDGNKQAVSGMDNAIILSKIVLLEERIKKLEEK